MKTPENLSTFILTGFQEPSRGTQKNSKKIAKKQTGGVEKNNRLLIINEKAIYL